MISISEKEAEFEDPCNIFQNCHSAYQIYNYLFGFNVVIYFHSQDHIPLDIAE